MLNVKNFRKEIEKYEGEKICNELGFIQVISKDNIRLLDKDKYYMIINNSKCIFEDCNEIVLDHNKCDKVIWFKASNGRRMLRICIDKNLLDRE